MNPVPEAIPEVQAHVCLSVARILFETHRTGFNSRKLAKFKDKGNCGRYQPDIVAAALRNNIKRGEGVSKLTELNIEVLFACVSTVLILQSAEKLTFALPMAP